MKKEYNNIELDIQELGYFLERALCAMIKQLNKVLRDEHLNLQHSGFLIMKILNEIDGVTQTELAEIMGKEKSGIGRSLICLEKEGYIKRNALNGCTNTVSLSEKGKQLIPSLNRIADKMTDLALTGFPVAQRKALMENLTLIYQNSRIVK